MLRIYSIINTVRQGYSVPYIGLAAERTLSSPDTAFRTVNGAYEKMRRELTEKRIC